MIIFTPCPDIKEILMAVRPDSYNFYEFNLSSYINRGISLTPIIPNPEYIPQEIIIGSAETPDFDIAYGNFIMGQKEQFFMFMNLVLPLYNDPSACVIVYIADSPVRNVIMESLIKLIQQRYGYNAYIVNVPTDIACVIDDSTFTPRGILNIQEDSMRALLEGYYGPITIPEE